MITYKPIIIQGGRRKDGTWPVKIRVTFKGKSRRVPTTLVCYDADLTRSGKIKNATILQRAGELIATMRGTCDNLSPFTLEAWSVDDVVAHIRETLTAQTFRLDFFSFADEYVKCKEGRTRNVYTTALNALERFLGKRELDINDITRPLLLDFVAFIDAEPNMHRNPKTGEWTETKRKKMPGGASAMHTAKLAHIFNAAKFRYNDEDTGRILIPRSPFDGLKKSYPPGDEASRPLTIEEMQAFINDQPEVRLEQTARAVFLLSLCTMGANLADLWWQKETPGEVWEYNRRKTGAEAKVRLPAQSYAFIRSLGGLQGPSPWWLPDLHRWSAENTAVGMVNKGLRSEAERLGINTYRLKYYSARKTWATQARKMGVEKATVDEGLTHKGDFSLTDIYAERNWSLSWDANEKVLALFNWEVPCPSGKK